MKLNKLLIAYAIILQLVTAIFLLGAQEPIRVASLGIFYNLFVIPQLGAILMLLGVILAIVGLKFGAPNRLRFLFFLPQYIFLLLTSGSALNYIMQGQYADGVIRPWQFIFIDQLHSLILTSFYTLSIFNFRKEKSERT